MRYITFAADFNEVSILGPNSDAQPPEDLGLSSDLVDEIADWNDRYQPIIPAEPSRRLAEPMASLIAELDAEGLRLARRIADSLGESAKVRYYSEGLLKEIP